MTDVKVGSKAPEFVSLDYEDMEIGSDDLRGMPYILYFYPKDDSPGCTKEACSFRDTLESFDELNIQVIGVSPDDQESHARFAEKHNLDFPLLCDENYELAKKFGVLEEKTVDGQKTLAYVRSTFLVDGDGIIRWIEKPVNVEGHANRVLEAIKKEKLVV